MTSFAGADARTITPSLDRPVFLAGFQQNRRATSVHRDLFVRTLALRDDGRAFVLAVCDTIGLVREDTLAIRGAVADLDADIVVASTHTHSGPDTIGLWGPDDATRGVDEVWLEQTRDTIAASIREAVAALEPAALTAATTHVAGVIQNYRDPGILDDEVGVLAFDRLDGTPIATLVNVPVHPEVLDGDSTVLSPDMAGAGASALERARGGVGIWASADLGGMQSPAEGARSFDEVDRKPGIVIDATLAALSGARPAPARLDFRGALVDIPLWNPRFRAGIAAGSLRGEIRAGKISTEVGVLDLGPARMAFWPGEVLPALGMLSKDWLGARFLVGLANDELGYILPRSSFVAPTDGRTPAEVTRSR